MPTATVPLATLPDVPRLYVDYLNGSPRIEPFGVPRPDWELLRAAAAALPETPGRAGAVAVLRAQAADLGAGPASRANVERLADPGTLAVVARAAPAPGGGPLRSALAVLSAIRLAERFEAAGRPAVALLSIAGPAGVAGPGLPETSDAAGSPGPGRAGAGDPAADPVVLELLGRCYAPGVPAATALARFFSRVFESSGLVVQTSGDPAWRRLEDPMVALARQRLPELAEVARETDARLAEAGYTVAEESTALVVEGLEPGCAAAGPRLAPVLEAALLGPGVVLVGPRRLEARVRAAPIARRLGTDLGPAWPRASATLADQRSRKFLERYGCALGDLFAGPDALLARLAAEHLPALGTRFDALASAVTGALEELGAAVAVGGAAGGRADGGLDAAIGASRTKMLYQLQKLKERVLAAQGARGEVLERHVRRACALLAPGGVRQEEALAFGDLMLRFSHGLPEELGRALDFASLDHQLIAVDGGA